MEHLDSEKEQLEQVKNWLRENGLSLVLGIVLGLGGVYGWRGWQSYQAGVAEEYSATLHTIQQHIDEERYDRAVAAAETMIGETGDSLYVDMSRLLLARAYVEQNELDKAAGPLAEIVANKDSVFNSIARIRLTRIYLAQSRLDEAGRLLEGNVDSPFSQVFIELKGDLDLARGQRDAARSAYQNALSMMDNGSSNPFLRMKLEDIPAAE
jgi:predicted negative regulator of RcsB-dependent stress response